MADVMPPTMPPPVQPDAAPQMPARPVLPLSKDDLAKWRGDLDKSRDLREKVQRWAEANLKKYAPSPADDPDEYGTKLNTNRDFTLVERKKADLFYQKPDVQAVPSPLFDGHEETLDAHTTILNESLGLDGVNAKALVHRVLFDVLCPSGTGWTVMGYESATIPTQTADPMTGLPTTVDVPIFEEVFWRHISPKQALIPHTFRSTLWDDAPWLGYDFEMPVRAARRKQWVDDKFEGSPADDELYFDHGLSQTAGDQVVRGQMIFYKSALYREDRSHPQHMTLLVLIDGKDEPAEHKDSPYQTIDPKGALTADSLIGFPIHPLTIRTLTDSSVVPSDCTISRPLVNELNAFREQMVQQRDAQLVLGFYDAGAMPPDAIQKIMRAPIHGLVGLPSDVFSQDHPIKPVERGPYPRENFTVNDYLDNDLARTHALDSNQQGAMSSSDTTATEAQIQQSNVNARLGLERGIVLDWYVQGVTKYSTLIQRYLPPARAAKIVGPEKAQMWESWRKIVPSSLAFTALPDATLRTDLASERKRALDEYSFFANDPLIDRAKLLKRTLPKLHYPADLIQTQPPQKGPEPTKPTFSFKGDDLNPLNPQFPIVMAILQQAGVTVPPEVIQEAQAGAQNAMLAQHVAGAQAGGPTGSDTTHGGKAAPVESLSKHQSDLSGGMQGTGQPAPMGSGGGLM